MASSMTQSDDEAATSAYITPSRMPTALRFISESLGMKPRLFVQASHIAETSGAVRVM